MRQLTDTEREWLEGLRYEDKFPDPQEVVLYSVARDCSHWTRVSEHPPAGIEWCETCLRWVGLIVSRLPSDVRVASTSGGSAALQENPQGEGPRND